MTTNSPILLFSFIVCSFLVCLTLTLANHQRYHVTKDYRSSETGKEAIVYEVYARSWLQQLSEEYGRPITRLTDIPRHDLQKLHDQKITTVWLQGVWQLQQPYPLKGSFGPHFPYYQFDFANGVDAVVDYVCNPNVGTDADLAAFKKKLNSVGLSLMLDFIPNHSSSNSPWVHSNPDLYVLLPTKNVSVVYDRNAFLPNGVAHGRDPLFAPWTNTAQWNYWNPATRNLRLQHLMKVASLSDAIRCDQAILVLNDVIDSIWGSNLASLGYLKPKTEWWQEAIKLVKQKYPDIKFFTELGLSGTLQSLGFDYTCDKNLVEMLMNMDFDGIKQYIVNTALNNPLLRQAKGYKPGWKTVVVASAVGAFAAPYITVFAVHSLGFTSAGIAAKSWAAYMMQYYAVANGGAVASGSLVATLQAVGTGAMGTVATAAASAVGALTAGATAASSFFSIPNSWKRSDKEKDSTTRSTG